MQQMFEGNVIETVIFNFGPPGQTNYDMASTEKKKESTV